MNTLCDQLEQKIYDKFYEMYPNGDARNKLWKAVLDTRKATNPEVDLNEVYNKIVNGDFE